MLVGFSAAVGSAAVLATSRPLLTVVAVALGLVAGFGITLFSGARRVGEGLATAEKPHLLNWPGTNEERRRLERAGRMRAGNAATVALILGAVSGLVPAVGVAFAGAGTAAAATAWSMRRAVRHFELERGVTVFAAQGAMQRRSPHRFGTA
jgi:hypothetical protein